MHGENHLFKYDFASWLIDSYHRYCIIKEVNYIKYNNIKGPYIGTILNNMNNNGIKTKYILKFEQYIWQNEYDTDAIMYDIDKYSEQLGSNIFENNNEIKDDIQKHFYDEINPSYENNNNNKQIYGQMYWFAQPDKILKRRKVVSSVQLQLEEAYDVVRNKQDTQAIILMKNGKLIKSSNNNQNVKQLYNIAVNDYNDILFRFMSSNGFYWSLVSSGKKGKKSDKYSLRFFKNAFQNYGDIICGPLTLKNINKINDNIFVFWIYIWTMSKVVKSYMQSGNITIPLQIDLVIIPNSTEHTAAHRNSNDYIDNISLFERFKIHDQLFHHGICDSTKIIAINQTLESVLTKCSNEMKQNNMKYEESQNDRIIIIVDRRIRDEYSDDGQYDHIFAYKPPNKYAQIDEEHEILNSIWNTSKFIIPPPTNYKHEELCGAQSNNLFVLSYIIRKKSQFIHLFDKDDIEIDYDEDDLENDIESIYSEESQSQSTRRSLRTKTDITARKFESNAAREFVPHLRKHKELTTLMLVALFEKVAEKTKKSMDIKELKELQTIQTFIMKLLMNRKRDSTVNTYLFYNKGYCRFEPLDLIRILPSFFNVNLIPNYSLMVNNFRKYHNKLWEFDDLIWMEYKRLYLQSQNAMYQQILIETIGTDHKDRAEITQYCKWNKTRQYNKIIHNKMDSKKILHLYQMVKLRSQKSLNLYSIIKKEKYKIEISLSIDIRKFLIVPTNDKHKPSVHGIKIKQVEKNDNGELFKEIGINHKGWYINSIDKESVEYGTINKFNNIMNEIMDMNQLPYNVIFIKVKHKKEKDKNKIQRKRTDSLIRPSHAKKDSLIRPSHAKKKSLGFNNQRNRSGGMHVTQPQTNTQQTFIPSLERLKSPQTLHVDVIDENIQNEQNNMLIIDHEEKKNNYNDDIKSCPNCNTERKQPSVKRWRMQCHKCRTQWCWQCNQVWNNKAYQDVLVCGNKNCQTTLYGN